MQLTLTGSCGVASPRLSTQLKNSIGTAANLARDGLEVPITLRQDNPSIARDRAIPPSCVAFEFPPSDRWQRQTVTSSGVLFVSLHRPYNESSFVVLKSRQ
jgi:hypothetical protein